MIKLIENPDMLIYDENKYHYYSNARSFGMYNKKLYVGDLNSTHGSLSYDNEEIMSSDEYKNAPDDRSDWDYPGRLWLDIKIISFWKHPPKSIFKFIISNLEKKTGLKLWGL